MWTKFAVRVAAIALPGLCAVPAIGAENVVVSNGPTRNMGFSGGVFSPTGENGVLNVGDLENALAAGNTTVTTGSLGDQSGDITVKSSLSWSAATSLTLDAFHGVDIEKSISDKGSGGLTLTTNDGGSGGTLWFGQDGRVTFSATANPLTIDGNAYTLISSLPALADAIAANPSGFYALANDYDASADGTYSTSPIGTDFGGVFNGLGNAISNITIVSNTERAAIGMFTSIEGTVASLRLDAESISVSRKYNAVGGLASNNGGQIFNDRVDVSAQATADLVDVGGLVETNSGSIIRSQASIEITTASPAAAGLVALNSAGAEIEDSFATGQISSFGHGGEMGGIVSVNGGTIDNCYAEVEVEGPSKSHTGGLVGLQQLGAIATSYSMGTVPAKAGGFVFNHESGPFQNDYWDTDTSGTDEGVRRGSSEGLTGLTTAEFQSGLPSGFDPAVWAEDAGINNGLPYLLDNPPPKTKK